MGMDQFHEMRDHAVATRQATNDVIDEYAEMAFEDATNVLLLLDFIRDRFIERAQRSQEAMQRVRDMANNLPPLVPPEPSATPEAAGGGGGATKHVMEGSEGQGQERVLEPKPWDKQ
jgi:hypothetical protein